MKKIIMFFYKYSGVLYIVDTVKSAVFVYKLRIRMVPVSYKLFLVVIGLTIGIGWSTSVRLYNIETQPIIFEQPLKINAVEAKETKEVAKIDELADLIWMRESTRGKSNYSKCDVIGKINGIGYAIPGDGSYICFDSHEEEMMALKGWLTAKSAAGMSEYNMLCLYSGSNYKECKKLDKK
jgi:hypothetical protein